MRAAGSEGDELETQAADETEALNPKHTCVLLGSHWLSGSRCVQPACCVELLLSCVSLVCQLCKLDACHPYIGADCCIILSKLQVCALVGGEWRGPGGGLREPEEVHLCGSGGAAVSAEAPAPAGRAGMHCSVPALQTPLGGVEGERAGCIEAGRGCHICAAVIKAVSESGQSSSSQAQI